MSFTHLHLHTEYSLLDGSGKVGEMVARAKELGMDSIAITDHGVMYGVIDFYKACLKEGIKPILGCEVYTAPGSRFDKESNVSESRYNHLILLAENNTGYANLMKIVSIGFTEGFYYKPRVDHEILEKYHEGIIALSACLAGEVPRALCMHMYEDAKDKALELERIFGKGNFFLELQNHGIPDQQLVNAQLIKMSNETGIELVCTNDVHYIKAEDAEPHDALLCIQTGKKLSDKDRMRYEGGQFYLKSEEEMRELFGNVPEALENTAKIADRCEVSIEFGKTKLPAYDVPEGYEGAEAYLRTLCEEGLKKRYPQVHFDGLSEPAKALSEPNIYRERLDTELQVITDMGYVDYFLIVWDYINYAKEHDIPVGPGRGSAAGSIVSYCLGITDIDPIKYNLVFERFLNPERVSMPDIDVDFCEEGRQQVIDYVVEKYGKDCVTQIITFGTMAARQVIKDVGRVMDIPYAQTDNVAKLIPTTLGITIDKALEISPDFKNIYENDAQLKKMIDTGKRLEGLPRQDSVHAAGVLVCDRPVTEYVPVALGKNDKIVSQFPMTTLEELGLLKMDFLGLRTLTVIRNACDLVKQRIPDFSMDDIPYDDKKVFDYISTGKCEGIFQLESSGMKSFMTELKPESIEDLTAGLSLYRPGPMDFIPQYIKGKNDKANVTYLCPQLEPILKATYGCIVYQEQVMQIVRDLAGYSWGRSDLVRRAMSKKKADVMEKERKNFIYGNEEEGVPGCVANGVPEKAAIEIFDEMTDFASYAFNKSHAACYAVVAYQTAYLKTYYPLEFMAALMTSVMSSADKVPAYINTCRQMGIEIVPPDVNASYGTFGVKDGKITFGMNAIKSLGGPTIEAIVNERDQNGRFATLNDFIRRMQSHLNKQSLENLIKSGALDSFGNPRRAMMMVSGEMLEREKKNSKDSLSGQMSLMDMLSGGGADSGGLDLEVPEAEEYDRRDILEYEKEVLGVYASGHPLEDHGRLIKAKATKTTADFKKDEAGNVHVSDGATCTVGGVITAVKKIFTKKNEQMAFITIEDVVGSLEVVVFPNVYSRFGNLVEEGGRVFITGNTNIEATGEAKFHANSVTAFDEIPCKLWLRFPDEAAYASAKEKIDVLIDKNEGIGEKQADIVIYCEKEKSKSNHGGRKTTVSGKMIKALEESFGEANVAVT